MFSNVAMLKKIQTESRKTRQIKKWLVMVARMLALAALVFAFARPFLPNENTKEGRQLVSIYLDNSESMRAEGEDGQLFENAKNSAREIIENLPLEAEIQILDNALSPFSNRIHTPANAIKLIDDLEIDHHPNEIQRIVQKINNKFISEGYASQHTFALSDFQQKSTANSVTLDSNLNLYMVRSVPSYLQNLSIDSVWLEEPVIKPESPVKLKIQVSNNGDQDIESSSLVLRINGVQQGVESFGISAKSQSVLDMAFTSSTKGWVSGEVSLSDVPVIFDNQYYFTLNIKSRIKVIQIGKRSTSIEKVFSQENDNVFSFIKVAEGNVDYAGLAGYDLIILNELTEIGSGFAEELRRYTEHGGIVVIFPNASVRKYVPLSTLLGLPSFDGLTKKDLSITPQNLKQPFIRDVYKRIPKNILLPKVKQCFSLEDKVGVQTILSLKDNSPILVRKSLGTGSLFQFALPLDGSFSNLSEHELFVLTMLKMAFSKSEKQRLAYTLFSKDAIGVSSLLGSEKKITLVKDDYSVLAESAINKGGLRFWLNDEVKESGVYSVQNGDNKEIASVALNYSRSESIQRFASNEELENQFGSSVKVIQSATAAIKNATDSISSGRPLWKFFILLCLIFLLIEILLLRFLKS